MREGMAGSRGPVVKPIDATPLRSLVPTALPLKSEMVDDPNNRQEQGQLQHCCGEAAFPSQHLVCKHVGNDPRTPTAK
jgi:hypothetical protein